MDVLYRFNILTHAVCSTLALLVGRKDGAMHVHFGRWFLRLAAMILLAATLSLAADLMLRICWPRCAMPPGPLPSGGQPAL